MVYCNCCKNYRLGQKHRGRHVGTHIPGPRIVRLANSSERVLPTLTAARKFARANAAKIVWTYE